MPKDSPELDNQLRDKLAKLVTLKFEDTPLISILLDSHIQKMIDFTIDYESIDEEEINLGEPISFQVEQISLRTALRSYPGRFPLFSRIFLV
jgi:hypothetical protein